MASTTRREEPKKLSIQGHSVPQPEEKTFEDRFGSFVGSEDESDTIQHSLIEQIVNMNLGLEKQIETLRLRLDFGRKHHHAANESEKLSMESEIKAKTIKIDALKTELNNKESSLSQLEEDNDNKRNKLAEIQTQISEMKQNVDSATTWITEIQKEIVNLESENRQLVSGEAFEKAQRDIATLKNEIYTFQQNIKVMSKELNRAREVVVSQGNSMKILETDKLNIQVKFKEDLQRITMSVRFEIERMRDIMQNQWSEMKYLREQNQTVRQDVKEIRNLLSLAQAQPDSSRLTKRQTESTLSSFPPSRNPTRKPSHPPLPSLSPKRTFVQRK
ncbi:unnamed protein product [Mytilus coruscus]|uniref:Uncharacterized protein n=1 Tax=Mytilus coruscus TaxID=42192 RepID=A0A6J8D1B7_MYTCO|nr:unnamed protein product [Mytilus coruscus]